MIVAGSFSESQISVLWSHLKLKEEWPGFSMKGALVGLQPNAFAATVSRCVNR